MSLAIVIRNAVRFFTATATCLLPEITLVYVFTTLKLWGKWGPSPPFRDWVITCMLFPKSMVFVQSCIILDEKASTSSLFVILTTSFKLVRSTVWFAVVPSELKVLLADMSTIRISLIYSKKPTTHTLTIQLMLGVSRVTSTQDPKTSRIWYD